MARRFSVLYCKPSTKKHKTWDGDGILQLTDRTLTLYSEDGDSMGQKQISIEMIENLVEGFEMRIGAKEVQIQNELCASGASDSARSNMASTEKEHAKSNRAPVSEQSARSNIASTEKEHAKSNRAPAPAPFSRPRPMSKFKSPVLSGDSVVRLLQPSQQLPSTSKSSDRPGAKHTNPFARREKRSVFKTIGGSPEGMDDSVRGSESVGPSVRDRANDTAVDVAGSSLVGHPVVKKAKVTTLESKLQPGLSPTCPKSDETSCETVPAPSTKRPKLKTGALVPANGIQPQPQITLPDPPTWWLHECGYTGTPNPVTIDPTLSRKLRPHQVEGVRFMYECVMGFKTITPYPGATPVRLSGAILADDMGLGKTVQTISLIWTLLQQNPISLFGVIRTVLLISPSSVMKHWMNEFRKWLGDRRCAVKVANKVTDVEKFRKGRNCNVLVLSYDLLHRCVDILKEIKFGLLVCDEGHRIKNSDTKANVGLTELPIERRLVLTGTPLHNNVRELFTICNFVQPGIFGSYQDFKKYYQDPILASGDGPDSNDASCAFDASRLDADGAETSRMAELTRVTAQFVLRRNYEVNRAFLTAKHEYILFCRPSELQIKLFKAIASVWKDGILGPAEHFRLLSALRKLSNHPMLLYHWLCEEKDDPLILALKRCFPPGTTNRSVQVEDSGKMAALSGLLFAMHKRGESEKLVLVSNFVQTLNMMEGLCQTYKLMVFRLDGSTPVKERQKLVDDFGKTKRQSVFLLSTKAGGVGLNLSAAQRLVLYDVDWNPAWDKQAVARIWRDGGSTEEKHVYRLITANTIDERILQHQMKKQELSDVIVDFNADSDGQDKCRICGEQFHRPEDLIEHNRERHNIFECPKCSQCFAKYANLKKHLGTEKHNQPGSVLYSCNYCAKSFARQENCRRHEKLHETPSTSKNDPTAASSEGPDEAKPTTSKPKRHAAAKASRSLSSDEGVIIESPENWSRLARYRHAFRGTIASYRLDENATQPMRDPKAYLDGLVDELSQQASKLLTRLTGIKLQLGLCIHFFKPTSTTEKAESYFWSFPVSIQRGDNVEDCIRSCFPKILSSYETFLRKGSGWVVDHVAYSELHLGRYRPLRGGCRVALPKYIKDKKALVNIESPDNKCFLWCILASRRNLLRNAHRWMSYNKEKYIKKLDLTGIRFPMEISQISRFEQQNKIAINVYSYDGDIFPLRISKYRGANDVVDLFYYQNHYCLIRNLDRFLADQRTHRGCKFFCHKCLFPFYYAHKRDEHVKLCINNECTVVRMAEKTHLQFENFHKMQKRQVCVYADFECITEETGAIADDMPKTAAYQKHTPCGFALVEANSCCGATEFKDPVGYRGPNCVDDFLKEVVQIGLEHQENLDNPAPLELSMQQEAEFHNATHCYLCKDAFLSDTDRVRDRCHRCGKYRGALHVNCNLKLRTDRNISVIFHNLRKYDGHLLMQRIGIACQKYCLEVDCTAKGMEDYLSFSLRMKGNSEEGTKSWKIDFIDSLQFMSASLEQLCKALPDDKFIALKKICKEDKELFALLRRKGVYSYDYMNKWERFDETQLPDKESFFNILSKSGISDEDYSHAQKVWDKFKMRTMGDYHNLYLLTDTLILADVFEAFRNLCLEQYGLDPPHYMTLPSLGWDACLKITDVKLELLQDPDMYILFEKGVRGGISVISHRYAKANNPLCPDTFDPARPKTHILYVDANNLYGWAMLQRLPHSEFKWMAAEEIEQTNWAEVPEDSDTGYILDVDLEYPSCLHDEHKDYPVAAEKLEILDEYLSPKCQQLLDDTKSQRCRGITKLVPNLWDKQNYIIHSAQLALCLRLGLKLSKVHRAISFKQSDWMRPYIELNTNLRTHAKTDFEKSMFKLMNNSVFGKTMEDVRAYREVKLATNEQQAEKLVASPRLKQFAIFNDNLAAFNMARRTTKLNKPIYVGFSVLEISKLLMYRFHYDHIRKRYGDNARLLFTDTDSFIYEIQTDDIYANMKEDHQMYDTSGFDPNHPLFSTANKKVVGKFKDETSGVPISAFAGVKSKMYGYICGGKETKRAKGIKKATVEHDMSFAQFAECVLEGTSRSHEMHFIRSKLHEIYSFRQEKRSLNPVDDKRYMLSDGITTLPYGHYSIDNIDDDCQIVYEAIPAEEPKTEPMDIN